MQVIVLSCWCRRQIKAFLLPGLSSALRTISPLFTVSPPSILLHLPPWWSNSQCDALFLFPSYSCQQYSICHSLLFFFLLTLAGWKKKKTRYLTYTCRPYFSLTHTYYFYPSKTPSLHILSLFTLRSPYFTLFFAGILWKTQMLHPSPQTLFNILSAIHYQDFMFSLIFTCTISHHQAYNCL